MVKKRFFWEFFSLIILAVLPQIIIYNTLPVIFLNDSVWYLDFTRYFSAGGFFPDYYAFSKPVQCMINYPLGYPLFLDCCRFLGPTIYWGKSIVLVQHLLSLGSVLLVFMIGLRTARRVEGFCASVVYALYLPRLFYIQAIMAETLCIFLMLLSLYIFLGVLKEGGGKITTGLLLGLVAAFSILTKPLAILGAAVFLIYFLISPVGRKTFMGFVFSLGIIIFANLSYNWYFYGQCVLTTASGIHLSDRVIAYDRLVDKTNPETKEIITRCRQSGMVFRFPGAWWDYFRALRSHGLSPQEADHLLMKASIAGIRSRPSIYVRRTFLVLATNIFEEDNWIDRRWISSRKSYFRYLKAWSTYPPGGILPAAEYESRRKMLNTISVDYPQGVWHDFGIRWIGFFDSKIFKLRGCVGWVFMFSFFYGLLARDRTMFFISSFIIVNLLFIAMTEAPFPRYFESLVPMAILAVFLSCSTFLKRILLPHT